MKKNINKEQGLIKMIILIVIAIAILSYYGVDIKDFFTSPQFQKNFGYVTEFIGDTWTTYLAEPAGRVWDIWVSYVWKPFVNILPEPKS
jgi:hypothetical protein